MIDIDRKTYEKLSIRTIIDNDGMLWLIAKNIEKVLNHKNLHKNSK